VLAVWSAPAHTVGDGCAQLVRQGGRWSWVREGEPAGGGDRRCASPCVRARRVVTAGASHL
jgi:hypothetical protein